MPGNAWNRQDGETARAFHLFTIYRDMAPSKRSLAVVGERVGRTPSYVRQLARWSSKYGWVQRAAAHDVHLDTVRLENQRQAIIEMGERQAEAGRLLQEAGLSKFLNPKTGKLRRAVSSMDDNDAIRAVVDGAKIERTARGEPTEIQKTDLTVRAKPMDQYTNEELAYIAEHGTPPPDNP